MATPYPASAPAGTSVVDWERLVRQHNPRVLLSLVAMGVPWGRTAEQAHGAWSRLIESHAAGALPVLKLPGLAIAQARYLVLEERRQAALQNGTFGSVERLEQLPDGGPSPERRAADRERVDRVLAKIGRSPPSAQRVFHLVYGRGQSHGETAAEVGLSVQRVRQILCELRQQAREALEEENQ